MCDFNWVCHTYITFYNYQTFLSTLISNPFFRASWIRPDVWRIAWTVLMIDIIKLSYSEYLNATYKKIFINWTLGPCKTLSCPGQFDYRVPIFNPKDINVAIPIFSFKLDFWGSGLFSNFDVSNYSTTLIILDQCKWYRRSVRLQKVHSADRLVRCCANNYSRPWVNNRKDLNSTYKRKSPADFLSNYYLNLLLKGT